MGHPRGDELSHRLRLLVVTDRRLASPRDVVEVVRLALEGGCRAVQLRDKESAARRLLSTAQELRSITREHGALLFVNDRVDVALAAEADGVHLGPTDLPVAAVRRWVGESLLVGYSTDDAEVARRAQDDGADYLGCGAVFGTRTKDVGDEAIGTARLDAVARAVSIPVVGLGGITPENVPAVAATAAAGAAVVGAVMAARDPTVVTRRLLEPFRRRRH